jgi:adenine-specific DNA-methyltransferase
MPRKSKPTAGRRVEALRHEEAKRRNIPTAEYQSVIQREAEEPLRVAYERRNRDLDPQLVWRGKDQQDANQNRSSSYPIRDRFLCRSAMRTCIGSGLSWTRYSVNRTSSR